MIQRLILNKSFWRKIQLEILLPLAEFAGVFWFCFFSWNTHLQIVNAMPQNFEEWLGNSYCYCSALIILKSLVFCLSYSQWLGQSLLLTNGLPSWQSPGMPALLLSCRQPLSIKGPVLPKSSQALDGGQNLREVVQPPSHAGKLISTTTFLCILPRRSTLLSSTISMEKCARLSCNYENNHSEYHFCD